MHEAGRVRLLMVTPRYLPLTGGVENHVREVARRLTEEFAVTVLTTDTTGELPPEETLDGVLVRRVPAWPRGRDYHVAPSLYRLVSESGSDLVHLQSYHTAVAPIALLAASRSGIPFVATFHGGGHSSRVRGLVRGTQRAVLRPLLSRAEKLVAVADFEATFFSQQLGIPAERFVVIPNGSDLPVPRTRPAGTDDHGRGTRVIASIGRLERYKGHQRVVAAMPQVLRREPDAELRVIGSGPYRDEILRLAGRLGVAERVSVRSIPARDRAGMAAALAESDLVVLLSEFETHPLSIVEAVALGRPALVADTSGLREIADRGLATAIALGSSPAETGDAIVEQLRHPPRVPEVHLPSWDECAEALARVYREAIGSRPPRLSRRASAGRDA